ncbi:hypothetical protein QVD17_37530 [Tagetes erecta]|uniref:Uncharacterized protein n=1 Tax=Tagetes erecta TaxID=13708 RepID=A0AAD8NJ98_TARER|nr:hypothetical protein QVD17_37530 [Tagetes erecta]
MSVSNLVTVLSVIFVVFILALAGEIIYVVWRHRSFRRRSSPSPHLHSHPITDAATKELLYFFCMKPVEFDQTEERKKNKDDQSSKNNDQVIDVFKLLDANKEEVELKPDVDFLNNLATVNIEEEVVVDRDTKTVFSTPCDSPMFYTPEGSPSRDLTESEFVVSVRISGNGYDR